ncbi:MAG: hypothetical protein MUF48_07090 [Pirellulaceae bacterium]|jgi:hypothetical protein|nr:hypothetical protein [Pirellulaceae bacterium]
MHPVSFLFLLACAPADGAEPPLSIWSSTTSRFVRQNVGRGDGPLGYSAQEMSYFPGHTHRLGYVSRLFRDAEAIPTETDRLARQMIAADSVQATCLALGLLGARITAATAVPETPPALVPADAASEAAWAGLPESIRNAVAQIVHGAAAAKPYLHKAFDWTALGRHGGDAQVRSLAGRAVYTYAAGPWLGGASGASLTALNTFEATPLGDATKICLTATSAALEVLADACQKQPLAAFDTILLKTPAGRVRILGPGHNTYAGTEPIVIDLGGDDRYSGRLAVPTSYAIPVGLLIDVAGNDTYDGRSGPASLACGLFGLGCLFDLGGDDQYLCGDSGLGCAWHGVGLLCDAAGNDTYAGNQWCQGAAHAGVGLLLDAEGDDKYFCQREAQGLGGTLGIGILVDKAGRDRYHAYDNENGRRITLPSSQTKAHEASLVQGCGYGRRADNTDGRSLAGGVGALFDGAGDDSYYGGVFSQAIGFWWSVGLLADLGGHDTYRGVYFAQGAAAHFAIGSHVDAAGNDHYNDSRVLGQTLGAGRDASIGTFVDVAGDDEYYLPKKSGGGGDMNSIGLFCDQRGADVYHPLSASTLGASTASNPRGESFRRMMPTIGVFADLDGADRYGATSSMKNGGTWRNPASAPLWGLGFDTQRP